MTELNAFQREFEAVLVDRLRAVSASVRNRRIERFANREEVVRADIGTLSITIFVDGVGVVDAQGLEERFEVNRPERERAAMREASDYILAVLQRSG